MSTINESASNEADEFFALQFALENAKETISEIIESLHRTPNYPIMKLRMKIKTSLSDFANVCLAQDKFFRKHKRSSKIKLNSRHGRVLNPVALAFQNPAPHFNPMPQMINLIPAPDFPNKIEDINQNKRIRKQNLFDVDKEIFFGDSDSPEADDINCSINDEKTVDVKGDLQATSDFLEKYRNNTNIEFNENCPEKFTMIQLENLGSTKYKRSNLKLVEECEVCFEEYTENENISFLSCYHKFHTTCIKNWLTKKNECPMCGIKACLDFTI